MNSPCYSIDGKASRPVPFFSGTGLLVYLSKACAARANTIFLAGGLTENRQKDNDNL
jgi:hypothetical protein